MSAPSTLCMRPPGHWRARQRAAQDHLQGAAPGQSLPLADRRDHRRRPRPAPPPPRPHHMINKHGKLLLGMVQCPTRAVVDDPVHDHRHRAGRLHRRPSVPLGRPAHPDPVDHHVEHPGAGGGPGGGVAGDRAQPIPGQHAVLRGGLPIPHGHRVLAAGAGSAAASGPADHRPDSDQLCRLSPLAALATAGQHQRRLRADGAGQGADSVRGDPSARAADFADSGRHLHRIHHSGPVHRRGVDRNDLRLGRDGPLLRDDDQQERRARRRGRRRVRRPDDRGRRDPGRPGRGGRRSPSAGRCLVTARIPAREPPVDVASAGSDTGERGTRRTHVSRQRLYLRRFLRNRGAVVGLAALTLLVVFALFGSLLTPYTYTDVDFANLSSAPSPEHLFGTNGAGNDTYAQAVHGLQRSLVIALVVSALTTMISAFVGAAAAYLGGLAEKIILAVVHFLLVVPSFLILALVSQRAHGDWPVLILVLTVFGWMFSARVVWSLTASLREREYVQAARFMGVGPIRIVVRHLIPNLGSLLIVSFTLGVVVTVQSETALSFIGFGVQPPDVSLGTMLSDGANTVSSAPWLFYVPAGLVTLLTVSMALIGDGLRDALDPTSRSGGRA